jgi:hypothetical protein
VPLVVRFDLASFVSGAVATLQELIDLLESALGDPFHRVEIASRFRAIVWEGLDPSLPKAAQEVLRELAYDLDFFEPKRDVRAAVSSSHGPERLEREIRETLEKLRQFESRPRAWRSTDD